ncbi:MAG: M4 family metallopeptidase, partial [Thermoleophilia bacterium]|nr:M4 family metallopeptidase [Thermoleophilia bacterium]
RDIGGVGPPESPDVELVVLPIPQGADPRLVWRVEVYVPSIPARWEYLVDAHTGTIIQKQDLVCDAATIGSGVGVLGDTKSPLYTYQSGSLYYLADTEQNIRTKSALDTSRRPVSDNDNFFWDGPAVDAHYYQRAVHDYFQTHLGYALNSHALSSFVHYADRNNALWDGRRILYGDGDGTLFAPLSGALDIVAHETTHAVTQWEAGLRYSYESGALNESFSDVLATLCEFAYPPPSPATPPDWDIGEDVYTPGSPGDALRSLADPTLYGTRSAPAGQPDHMAFFVDTTWDRGGVHTNSGIPNKAAYLLSVGGTHRYGQVTVDPIGLAKTEQIWFRMLRYYLSPSTYRFTDAARLSVQAAIDLYGDGTEAASVREAWRAVGVGDAFPICTAADPYPTWGPDDPAISGNIVVWHDSRNTPPGMNSRDIYGYDLAAGQEFPICTAEGQQVCPDISGQTVVWVDYRGMLMPDPADRYIEIRGYNLATAQEFVISAGYHDYGCPEISGNVVVWDDTRNWEATRGDIYGYDLATGQEFAICTAAGTQRYPAISGNIVVWQDYRNSPPDEYDSDIYGYDLATRQEFAICTAAGAQQYPAISGSIVVWNDARALGGGNYGCDLTTGREFSFVTDAGALYYPAISGNIVVGVYGTMDRIWGYNLATGWDVPIHNSAPGSRGAVSPAIDGNTVVWATLFDNGMDIYGIYHPWWYTQ